MSENVLGLSPVSAINRMSCSYMLQRLRFCVHSVMWVFVCVVWYNCASPDQVCGLSVCLLFLHPSHWVICLLVIATLTLQWHMPPSWLSDWQDRYRGESKECWSKSHLVLFVLLSDIQSVTHTSFVLFMCYMLHIVLCVVRNVPHGRN